MMQAKYDDIILHAYGQEKAEVWRLLGNSIETIWASSDVMLLDCM